jgi:hypothetical protein
LACLASALERYLTEGLIDLLRAHAPSSLELLDRRFDLALLSQELLALRAARLSPQLRSYVGALCSNRARACCCEPLCAAE